MNILVNLFIFVSFTKLCDTQSSDFEKKNMLDLAHNRGIRIRYYLDNTSLKSGIKMSLQRLLDASRREIA